MIYVILALLAVFSCFFKLHLTNGSLVIPTSEKLPDYLADYIFWNAVVFAPFLEEVVFRKYLLGHLKKYLPWWSAIGLSTFCFTMVHEIPQQRILVIPLGLILGFLYYKTNKLRYCIFLHFCNNFLVFSLLKWPDFFVFEPIYLAISSITFVGMAFFISLFWLINYLDKKN